MTMVRSTATLTLELTLLGVLDRTPMHGYALAKAVAGLDGFGLVWKIKRGALYALLDKLEARGLLQGSLVPGENHPSRREFQVTGPGRRALEAWMGQPVDNIRSMRQDFFARLYFARQASREQALDLVRRQREACLVWQADIQAKLRAPGGEFTRVVLTHRLHIVQATLAWMDDYRRDLA
jgi:DNA-binding PadR family transcriptional regulator